MLIGSYFLLDSRKLCKFGTLITLDSYDSGEKDAEFFKMQCIFRAFVPTFVLSTTPEEHPTGDLQPFRPDKKKKKLLTTFPEENSALGIQL